MNSTKKRQSKTQLRNGCSRTQVYFSPADLLSAKSSDVLLKDCFLECRFYDPEFSKEYPNGFQFRKRLNEFKTLKERKSAALIFKKEMEKLLDLKNYNPISKAFMSDRSGELTPFMDVKSALEKCRLKISGSDSHKSEVRIAVNRFNKALDELSYSYINIRDIKIWHIKNTLDYINLKPSYYNKFRAYLSTVFKELVEYGCIEANPVRDISKKKIEKSEREIIDDNSDFYVTQYLKENFYTFYRYKQIFSMSGGRSTELFRLQKKHISLENQEYRVYIKKGSSYKWETKVIFKKAIPYWRELLEFCKNDDDYIFSYGLIPGGKKNNSRQITKRWKCHVKDSDKIKDESGKVIKVTADFYAYKHKFLDKLDALQYNTPIIPIDFNIAQAAGSHTTENTTSIYTVGKKQRKIDLMKNISL